MKITGIISIKNGIGLGYPFPIVIDNLSRLCDNVIVGLDNRPEFSADWTMTHSLGLSNVQIVDAPWDDSNRNDGSEIAIQMDNLVNIAKEQGSDWVVVMQADELLHDDDFPMLLAFMERNLYTEVTGFSMQRLYFWKDLDTVRTDWAANLVRIFKPGTYSFMADGTDKAGMFSAPVAPGSELALPYKIYHYSRVDAPDVISRRVRNLDALFHPEETLLSVEDLPDYDFTPREYDNFAKTGFPKEVEGLFEKFGGTHPVGVLDWYTE